ncbi:MAG: L-carnitine dehydrogenase [Proteobacteria bacterium]|nr:L-carnitine dehydrogenase [Pseudomonadota bacterium]MBT4106413.1 L-carnitine dehydrogenase [Pseudomonadota bacterium]MBT4357945.1 L-carnitine dehydrogenase [Pseudomonadota bacterium]MBT5189150.1 L-carnitine dehydrogenase [Pseudomonadota bacterium]MBT5624416.1 L-carnitine dehydrogenase [Pseudomonadota bacterium]
MTQQEIKTIALVGGGVIGGGWATRCLANGLNVVVTDPRPESRDYVERMIDEAWPILEEADLIAESSGQLSFVDNIEAAVAQADFVQENVPEREDLKIAIHQEISENVRADVVIASSSSGLLPSRLQSQCKHPERLLIGHPFAPVYLLPLVEVVGSEQTSSVAVSRAGAFYRSIGMRPLHVRREIEAYIADRLQESLYREALHLIDQGVATVAEIDAAVTGGPGLRWAFMGTFLAWHLGGGPGGMRHTIEQFGPALELPWSHMKAPELTDELKQRIVEGCEDESGDRVFSEMERRRDRCLVEIQKVLKEHWYSEDEDGWPKMV